MSIQRIFQRIGFYSIKKILVLISYFNHRIWMKLYVPYLKHYGMKFIDNGVPRYIAKSVYFDDFDKISLSERDVISGDVSFLTHDYSYTTALISAGEMPSSDIAMIKPITVGKNVFIGARSFVLPGTQIGDNCIIGAGSVVRGVIPSGSICIGNPARVVKSISDAYEKWKQLSANSLRKD